MYSHVTGDPVDTDAPGRWPYILDLDGDIAQYLLSGAASWLGTCLGGGLIVGEDGHRAASGFGGSNELPHQTIQRGTGNAEEIPMHHRSRLLIHHLAYPLTCLRSGISPENEGAGSS